MRRFLTNISSKIWKEVQYINFHWNSLATRQNLAPRTPKEGICHSSSSSGHSSYWSIKWVAGGCIWLSNLALAAPAENESITAVTALALCWGSWLQIDKVFLQMTRILSMTSCLLQRDWPTQQLSGQGSRCLDKQVGCSWFDNFLQMTRNHKLTPCLGLQPVWQLFSNGCDIYERKFSKIVFIFLQVLPGR